MAEFRPAPSLAPSTYTVTRTNTHTYTERYSTEQATEQELLPHDIDRSIQNIARQSLKHGLELNAYDPEPGGHLDPASPTFNARAWVATLRRLCETDLNAAPSRFLGVAFSKLGAYGWTTGSESQSTVHNIFWSICSSLAALVGIASRATRVNILKDFEGVLEPGELLLVLGPPGSGCSTFLKSLTGDTTGFTLTQDTYLNYRGLDPKQIRTSLRGDVLYNAEVDSHLPHLTVGETLTFAARCRSVRCIPGGFSREQADNTLRDVMMKIFGISHAFNTRVGDDFIRGVSGGERKRVSIAEAALTGAKFQCWDNSTRGLDSANAINFCENLRLQADVLGISSAVALYQAPQSAYEKFDRVIVLYEGRQIFYGKTSEAKSYFEALGFECKSLSQVLTSPTRQTTPDFLTSMTSPSERRAKPGWEDKVPQNADEFATEWCLSRARERLVAELAEYEAKHPSAVRSEEFNRSRGAEQARLQRLRSPYTISYLQQVRLTVWRSYRRLIAEPGFTIASILYNLIISLLLGSTFYNMKTDSSTMNYRGAIIFFSLLFNAFASQLEILMVYAERPVVEKHNRYAFYHQSTQAIASYIMDLPYKTANMFIFNVILYFMSNLRREAGSFFFFCLVTYTTTLVMSSLYRWLASITRTAYQAMVPSAIMSLGLMIYTGYTIPTSYLPGWSRWMNYINPLAYAFEALMANEFHGRQFPCAQAIPQGPGYENLPIQSYAYTTIGSIPGTNLVDGETYINLTYDYYNTNKWRNVGILFAFLVFLFTVYIFAAEHSKPPKSKGEILIFHSSKKVPAPVPATGDVESLSYPMREIRNKNSDPKTTTGLSAGSAVFHWENLCYDIHIKGEERRILDNVDGWVKPGTSTALMGVSGAGKTTLLDVLASRVTMGVVSGETLINGKPTDVSFQHRVGYVQQQDLHLNTTTVREALQFSALLRQSAEIPEKEKMEYVEQVIENLEMEKYADAVVGVPGEGLNVEQRKRLTIGIELAARPQLLLFLDEPTSGLDSQTSWSICQLIKKLTRSGQAILCTIHQPSALLFEQFDRLLLLAPGGKTVYFGELGPRSRTLIEYLERNGAPECPSEANQAEWMLEVVIPPTDGSVGIDWHEVWRNSPEFQDVKAELSRLRSLPQAGQTDASADTESSQHREFVASLWTQYCIVLSRTWKHFWRSPVYIWSKIILIVVSSIYIGFSFHAKNTIQGLQNQLYAIFMFLVMFNNINQQIMPVFIPQRSLYEVRERPSKVYHWSAFLISNILVEAFWNTLMAALVYFCWYYPVGFVINTTGDDQTVRGLLVFLFLWMFMLFTSTFSHFAVSWMPSSEIAGILASMLFMFCLVFCGVAIPRSDLPHFWRFMHTISPASYLVGGVMSAAIAGAAVTCSETELLKLEPPNNMTCGQFIGPFAEFTRGKLLNPDSREGCKYCIFTHTDQFLSQFDIEYADRWRNFGVLWVYIIFNVFAVMGLYWLCRMPKREGRKTVKRPE